MIKELKINVEKKKVNKRYTFKVLRTNKISNSMRIIIVKRERQKIKFEIYK